MTRVADPGSLTVRTLVVGGGESQDSRLEPLPALLLDEIRQLTLLVCFRFSPDLT